MTLHRLRRSWRPLAFFYRRQCVATLIVNACCLSIFLESGIDGLPAVLWIKAITNAAVVFIVNQRSGGSFYYYYNLGLSRAALWGATLALDFGIFISMLIVALLAR